LAVHISFSLLSRLFVAQNAYIGLELSRTSITKKDYYVLSLYKKGNLAVWQNVTIYLLQYKKFEQSSLDARKPIAFPVQ